MEADKKSLFKQMSDPVPAHSICVIEDGIKSLQSKVLGRSVN